MRQREPKSISFRSLVPGLLGWAVMGSVQAFAQATEEDATWCKSDTGSVGAPMSVPINTIPAVEIANLQIMAGPLPRSVPVGLAFRTDHAAIDVTSFQALYGAPKLDITDGIAEIAKAAASSLRIDNAQTPKETHRLFLAVSDVMGLRTDRELPIQVE